MEDDLFLSSLQNPRVKDVVKLRSRSERDAQQLFLIEGYRELLRAVSAGWDIQSLFYCPEYFLGTNEEALIANIHARETQLFRCSQAVFDKMSYRDRPDGLIASAPQRRLSLSDIPLTSNSLYLVAEAIEKPGNLGTMLRSADAVAATAVIVCDRCPDIYNPNVVRASVGTLFTLPVVEASSEEALKWLYNNKITILAATPQAQLLFTEADMRQPLAIAVGTEQLGLSPVWMQKAHLQVKIPMLGTTDSLNVATATTLLLYEAVRQRCL